MNAVTGFFTPTVRRSIYLTLLALVPIATLYGWVNEEQAALWVGAIGAVLGFGTAAANTPSTPVYQAVDNA